MFTTNNTQSPSSGNFYRKYFRFNSDSQKLFDSVEVKIWNSTPKNWRKFSIKLCSQEKHTAIPYYSSFKDRIDTLIQTPFINEIKKLNLMWCNFVYLFIYRDYLFIRIIVLVISFSAYVVNLSYFLVKCFLVSILNLVAFFIFCISTYKLFMQRPHTACLEYC